MAHNNNGCKVSEKNKLTPVMQQYVDMKSENPDALLMFRLGDFYESFFEDAKIISVKLMSASEKLEKGLADAAKEAGVKVTCNRYGAMMTLFFNDAPVTDYDTAKKSDTKMFAKYFKGMLERKIYLAPSQFEARFVSGAHTDSDIERTITAAKEVFSSL